MPAFGSALMDSFENGEHLRLGCDRSGLGNVAEFDVGSGACPSKIGIHIFFVALEGVLYARWKAHI